MTSRCSVSAGFEADVRDGHVPGVEAPRRDREADLGAVHGHGHVRLNRRTGNFPGRGVHAGGDVDREHRNADCVDLLDHLRGLVARRSLEPGAEQRVDHDVRPLVDELAPLRPQDLAGDAPVSPVGAATRRGSRCAARRASGASALLRRRRRRAASSRRRRGPPPRRASPRPCRAARAQPSLAIATACASSRECVIERSTEPTPSAAARSARRPESRTAGFGRPTISISCHANARATPKPSALPTASLPAKRPA